MFLGLERIKIQEFKYEFFIIEFLIHLLGSTLILKKTGTTKSLIYQMVIKK